MVLLYELQVDLADQPAPTNSVTVSSMHHVRSFELGGSETEDVVREPMRGREISVPFVVVLFGVAGVFGAPTPLSSL